MANGKREISKAERNAYICALMVNFVDQMGPQFTGPVLVTYGQWIGASLSTIAMFQTARGLSAMASNIWMPIVSDRAGRKWIAFLSVCGVSLGYFIQAIAYTFRGDGENLEDWGPPCICFICGRFVTGFFAGMQPVLQAYITELSAPDAELVTQRLVVMQVAANVGGMFLSPIAGVVATLGLEVPFFIVTVVGVISIFLVPIYFKEVAEIRGPAPPTPMLGAGPSVSVGAAPQEVTASQETQTGSSEAKDAPLLAPESASSAAPPPAAIKKGSPFCDLVIGFMFVGYMCLMIMVNGGSLFLTPLLFQQPSFEISGKDSDGNFNEDIFKQNVSKNVGFANIPVGCLQVLVAITLFVPVTKRFGEVPTIMVMGIMGSACFPLVILIGDKVWKVALIFGFLGMAFGFLTPALGPVSARYGRAIYPKQMALVQGIPLVGLQLSNAFAQNILAPIVGDLDSPDLMSHLKNAYFFVGGASLLFTVVFSCASHLSAARVAEHQKLMGITPSAAGDDDDDDILFQITLKRSAASVGETRIAVPFATPVMRRAMSERASRKRTAARDVGQSLQPVDGASGVNGSVLGGDGS